MNKIRHLLTNKFFLIAVTLVVIVEIGFIILIAKTPIELDTKIGVSILTGVPLFIIAILQIYYNGRLQKTDFVRDYSEEFFTNKELYSAFHELVYTYSDSDFDKICELFKDKSKTKTDSRPLFIDCERSFGEVKIGSRLYHPKWFQGSVEEQRLDMLIGYFDLLGYQFSKGFVSLEDLMGSLGHYLTMLSKRKVIQEVERVYKEAIDDENYQKANGRLRPFRHFELLMLAVVEYNNKLEAKISKAKAKAKKADEEVKKAGDPNPDI